MKYKIKYYFDGNGEVEIEAKSEKEARDIFYEGGWEDEKEWGDNYCIQDIE